VPHIFGKLSMKAIIILLDLTSIGGLKKKLWAFKVAGVPILGFLGVPI
jgi:hypothetical protein